MKLLNRHGFTLMELMVALAMSGIISAAMYAAYTGLQRVSADQALIVEMQQNLRAGLDMMAREIRMAGYDPDRKWGAGFPSSPMSPHPGTTGTSVTFTMNDVDDEDGDGILDGHDTIDNDGDGQINEEGELRTVSYSFGDGYGDGTNDVLRRADNGVPSVLIENVERLEFYYTLVNGTQVLNPTVAQLSQIRSVQISILARAPGASLNYVNRNSYTSASGSIWGPFNDNIRRRFQIINVNCRNM